jgi:hypothetical protein
VVLVQNLGSPVSKTYNMNATVGRDHFALFQFIQQFKKSIMHCVMAQALLTSDATKKGRR